MISPEDREHRLRAEADLGDSSDRLFREPAFKAAVDAVRDRINQEFLNAATEAERLTVQSRMLGLNAVLQELRTASDTGKMARTSLREMWEAAKERVRGSSVA